MLNFHLHLLPRFCLLPLWLSPRSHQDSGAQPLLVGVSSFWLELAVAVQGCGEVGTGSGCCGAACMEECLVQGAAELLGLGAAAAGACGGNQPPGTPWHGLVAWLLSWIDSSTCQLPT